MGAGDMERDARLWGAGTMEKNTTVRSREKWEGDMP
jgi:hypothetical protein